MESSRNTGLCTIETAMELGRDPKFTHLLTQFHIARKQHQYNEYVTVNTAGLKILFAARRVWVQVHPGHQSQTFLNMEAIVDEQGRSGAAPPYRSRSQQSLASAEEDVHQIGSCAAFAIGNSRTQIGSCRSPRQAARSAWPCSRR